MIVRGLMLGLGAIASLVRPALAEPARGAAVPWITYEAEETASRTGTTLGPDYIGQTPAREASGRQCVRLSGAGDYVEFTAKADARGLVLRYGIPDSADGRGLDATLGLSINGKPLDKLKLTSRFTHLYGAYPFKNEPAAGTPRNFWDEVRVMPGDIKAGDVIRIEKGSDDSAAEYFIDFIDLEPVPAPLAKPAEALSIIDFGATANDATDDRAAFVAAITAGKAQKKGVFIPAGQFVVKGLIEVGDVTITGAGMWHTTLVGADDYTPAGRVAFEGTGSNVTLSDFAIIGKLNYRNDSEANDGIGGSFGTGSTIRNLWIEHTKTGAWVVNSDGLLIEGCRFRNNIADGINLCIGMRNSIVRNCSARGTGDDCFAMWPATYAKSTYTHGGNRYVNCTAQLPFLAQAFSIYGGDGNAVENCEAIDIPYGAGLYASTTFPTEFGFRGTTIYRHNKLTRTGGGDGAIGTVANLIDLVGVRFEDIEVIDSATDGIRFTSMNKRALRDATFDRIKIVNPGIGGSGHAIAEGDGSVGSAKLNNVSIVGAKAALHDVSPSFEIVRGNGNTGIENDTTSSSGQSPVPRATMER